MPKIDLDAIPPEPLGDIPPEFLEAATGRIVRNLSRAGGLADFVANHVVVPPGGWSAQRHWHEGEDEIAVVIAGTGALVDDHGRRPMSAGDVAVFRKDDGNAHHLVNDGDAPLILLAISVPEASTVHYPDIGKRWSPDTGLEDERRQRR